MAGTLGIIGFGNMGSAIVNGLVASGACMPSDIHVADADEARLERAKEAGHFTHATVAALGETADVIIIAVKPKDVPKVLDNLKGTRKETLVVSIAAGFSLEDIEAALPENPIIRVMPNTPCMVGAGVSMMCRGSKAGDRQVETAKEILGAVGYAGEVPEGMMDAVTGLSGSGPAFVAVMIDALSDGGVKMGLPRPLALRLAAETVFGTAKMIIEKNMHPSVLRDMVTSPGGTTIEGIAVLEANAFRASLIEAVEAAALRSEELGSK